MQAVAPTTRRTPPPRRSALPVRLAPLAYFAAVLLLLLATTGVRAGTAGAQAPRLVADAERVVDVLALADERLSLMPAIACAKQRAGLPLLDVARETAVVDALERAAGDVGLDPTTAAAVLRAQLELARNAQTRARAEFPVDASGAAAQARDCESLATLRARLDAWTPRFVRALQLGAAPLQRAAGDGSLAALAAERLGAPRWSARDRESLVSALLAVRMRAAPSLARARSIGVLRIGTPADYAPFAVERDGVLEGADVELALRIAGALGLEAVFVRTSWRALVDDLRADRFDIAVGGISITPERDGAGDFALPHARGGKTAIGRCADARRFRSLATIDRTGVRVIVNPGGTNERFAREHVRRAEVRVHADNRTIFDEIVAGRADAMFTDDTEVALQTRRHPELCRLVRRIWMPAAKAVLLQPDPGLRAAVDAWLAPAIADGVPRALLDEALAR